jgi:hypothetical protein
MKRLLGPRVGFAVLALAVMTTAVVVGQGQREGTPAPAGQGRGQGQGRGRGAPPPPPEPQAGHPSGKLVIWGDIANFDQPATAPTHCIITNRFQRGHRVGFRMTAIDGGSGETENTAVLTVHVTYAGKTVDVPMRWRGNLPFPASEYPRNPAEMWTGVWTVPDDAPIGTVSYTVTAVDRFNRMATFSPFPNTVSQLSVVE